MVSVYEQSDLNDARKSVTKSSGCSQAAKCVPLSCLLKKMSLAYAFSAQLFPGVFFIGREAGWRRAAHRQGLRHIGGYGSGHVGVNGGQSRRLWHGRHLGKGV